MRIRLYSTYYEEENPIRDMELRQTVLWNAENSGIDQIVVLMEGGKRIIHDKVMCIGVSSRPTFQDIINVANCMAAQDDISILANADILVPSASTKYIRDIMRPNLCLALSRWEFDADKTGVTLYNTDSSQDLWAFYGFMHVGAADIKIGTWACDNRFASVISRAGYLVRNYCLDIITIHNHNSGVRTYSSQISNEYEPLYVLPASAVNVFSLVKRSIESKEVDYRLRYKVYLLYYYLVKGARVLLGRFSPKMLMQEYSNIWSKMPEVTLKVDVR